MKRILAYLFVLLQTVAAWAGGDEHLTAGNNAYRDGKFDLAVKEYETALESGQVSWPAFYNLGNAYYKTGNLARAILNYEKALRLNPAHPDVRHNLSLSNLQIEDKRPDYTDTGLMGIWNSIERKFTVDGWAWISIVFTFLVFFTVVGIYSVRNGMLKRLLFASVFVWIFCSLMAIVFAQSQYAAFRKKEGIIMELALNVSSEPKTSSTALFVLHSGSKVEVLDASGDWLKIKYDPQKIGWVPKASLEMIALQ